MMKKLAGLLKEEEGQGMTEYGLVLGLIAVAVVATLVFLRGEIVKIFDDVKTAITSRGDTGSTAPAPSTAP
jgi:pilus assembly protein Flp/PilA